VGHGPRQVPASADQAHPKGRLTGNRGLRRSHARQEIWARCAGRKKEAVQLHRSVHFYGPIFTTIHFRVAALLCYSVRCMTDLRYYVSLGFCNL